MKRVHFFIPGDPNRRTGGSIYDRRIMAGLVALGWEVGLHRLAGRFPMPEPQDLAEAESYLRTLPEGSLGVIDGLALGGMPALVAELRRRLRIVALIHHPLALESGLEDTLRRRLHFGERAALQQVRRVIVTSPSTAQALMADYAVPAECCAVVSPGVDPAPLAEGSNGETLDLLCVANLIPRKGHAVLLQALARLRDRPWRLCCVGDGGLSPETAAALQTLAGAGGLSDRVEFRASLDGDALADCYRRADLFVLASLHEGYGMALAEALACGLPIVSTTAGAIPDTVPAAAGLLVPPGDVDALTEALQRVLDEPPLRARLAAGARVVRAALPDWPSAAGRFAEQLEQVPNR